MSSQRYISRFTAGNERETDRVGVMVYKRLCLLRPRARVQVEP
jgi:hypothetical protein